MSHFILTLLLWLNCSESAALKTNGNEDSYCNARFGYCIGYPAGVLTPQEESANGDGKKFTNQKGEVILTVFGRLNLDSEGEVISLSKQYSNDLARLQKHATISYKASGKDFYVISGQYKNGKTFYHKMILKHDAFCFALLEYGTDQKTVFDKYATVVFRTFK
ncbi:hypothetical protein [Pseudobacter ginsenosidimutans]|nr:hypothetical protein [Pseudobacter ginsenosidimutans]QEC44768.1 hypothetical protein FSB84_24925 [Pseudobacter ginsenosidimutans]